MEVQACIGDRETTTAKFCQGEPGSAPRISVHQCIGAQPFGNGENHVVNQAIQIIRHRRFGEQEWLCVSRYLGASEGRSDNPALPVEIYRPQTIEASVCGVES